jgi:virginiamycin A acetyltransferase
MKTTDKLAAFKAGTLESIPVGSDKLAQLGITNGRFLQNCLFEKAVNLSSQVISRKRGVFMGAYSYMNDGGYMRDGVFVGRYCSIGRRVSIGGGNHPMAGLSSHPLLVYGNGSPYSPAEVELLRIKKFDASRTIIENDVWIGDGAVILAGVTIGTGAVIGANSVVTRDVPPYAISAGASARILRFRFPHEVISRLLESEWWEHPVESLRALPVGNVFEFIEASGSLKSTKESSAIEFETHRLE